MLGYRPRSAADFGAGETDFRWFSVNVVERCGHSSAAQEHPVDACNDPTASNTTLILCFILREGKIKVKTELPAPQLATTD